jgi:hypothetical protein
MFVLVYTGLCLLPFLVTGVWKCGENVCFEWTTKEKQNHLILPKRFANVPQEDNALVNQVNANVQVS